MKEKILTFIIGFLVGAIIATTGFLIYSKTIANNVTQPEMMQMNGNGQMGEPPEKPSVDNGEQPPTKPEESNNSIVE